MTVFYSTPKAIAAALAEFGVDEFPYSYPSQVAVHDSDLYAEHFANHEPRDEEGASDRAEHSRTCGYIRVGGQRRELRIGDFSWADHKGVSVDPLGTQALAAGAAPGDLIIAWDHRRDGGEGTSDTTLSVIPITEKFLEAARAAAWRHGNRQRWQEDAMMNFTFILVSKDPAAHVAGWRAAAGAAGAHFPEEFKPLASRGLDPKSVLLAAVAATEVVAERCPPHLVQPRGCRAEFGGGQVRLVWETDHHKVSLWCDSRRLTGEMRILATVDESDQLEAAVDAYCAADVEVPRPRPEMEAIVLLIPRAAAALAAAKTVDPEARFEMV